MRNNRHKFVLASAATIILANASIAEGRGRRPSTPTTPPPASQFPLNGSATFQATNSYFNVETDEFGKPYIERTGGTGAGGLVISYDASRGTYSLRDPADGYSTVTSNRSYTSGNFQVFSRSTTSASDVVSLFKGASSPLKLTYTNFGYWRHIDKVSGGDRTYAFVYGFRTPASALPRTGTANYQTMVHAKSTVHGTSGGQFAVGGTATFVADFGGSQVSTQLNLNYVESQNPIGTFNGSADIGSDGQFMGQLLSSDSKMFVAGSFAGAFFGPAAQEMGYNFSIFRHNYDPYAGAAAYFHDEAIVGSVIGTRSR